MPSDDSRRAFNASDYEDVQTQPTEVQRAQQVGGSHAADFTRAHPATRATTKQPAAGSLVQAERAPRQGRGSTEPERLVTNVRRHGRYLFMPALIFIAVCGLVPFLMGRFGESWINIAIVVAGIVVVLLMSAMPFVYWLGNRSTLTTRRVIVRRGFFTRERTELLLVRGFQVSIRRGPLQAMFGSGDIVIDTGVAHPTVVPDVPRAKSFLAALHGVMAEL